MTVVAMQVYRDAADDLDQGWIRGHWYTMDGKCLVQALSDAAQTPLRDEALPAYLTAPLDAKLTAITEDA